MIKPTDICQLTLESEVYFMEETLGKRIAACDTIGAPDPDTDVRIYVNGNASFGHICFRYI